jgi:hypothetical protein
MTDPHAQAFLGRIRRSATRQSAVRLLFLLLFVALAALMWGVWPMVAIFAIGAVVAAVKLAGRLPSALDPRRDECFRALAAYGDPDQAAAEVGRALAGPAPRLLKVLVSPEWIVFPDLTAVRPRDLMWLYRNQTTTVRKTYGMETGRSVTHSAIVVVRRLDVGKGARVPLKKEIAGTQDAVQGLLIGLSRAAPWAVSGYSKELEAAFGLAAYEKTFQQVDGRRATMQPAG